MTRLREIEKIGEQNAKKLREAGILSIQALLDKGGSPQGRRLLAKATGIQEKDLLVWINNADLLRIRGIGEEYAELLENAKVNSVGNLAQCSPVDLHRMLLTANERINLVRQIPSLNQVKHWIEQAKQLPQVIRH